MQRAHAAQHAASRALPTTTPASESPDLGAWRRHLSSRRTDALPFIYPLLATYLLTGGRETEVLGLEVGDVNFERKTITFRPNQWRRLKTDASHRTVPLWPQLEAILLTYLRSDYAPPIGGLLFPSRNGGMVTDFRKALDVVAQRAGWKRGEVRSKAFRHTYCAAQLQTLDAGASVSIYTVGKELGHGGDALVKRVYGHLGTVRHRAEAIEYRVEQHAGQLGERLQLVRSAELTEQGFRPAEVPREALPDVGNAGSLATRAGLPVIVCRPVGAITPLMFRSTVGGCDARGVLNAAARF